MNTKYRLKFTKTGKLRFVGHLDLMNVFRRAIKRADLPIAFSAGFNPHQILSFALPLPVGMGSLGEYADFELKTDMPSETVMEALNKQMPDGIRITLCRELAPGEKPAAAAVCAAIYEIEFCAPVKDVCAQILNSKELIITKESKTKKELADIRPHIHRLTVCKDDDSVVTAVLSAGSKVNLKASLFISHIKDAVNIAGWSEPSTTRVDLLTGELEPLSIV